MIVWYLQLKHKKRIEDLEMKENKENVKVLTGEDVLNLSTFSKRVLSEPPKLAQKKKPGTDQ